MVCYTENANDTGEYNHCYLAHCPLVFQISLATWTLCCSPLPTSLNFPVLRLVLVHFILFLAFNAPSLASQLPFRLAPKLPMPKKPDYILECLELASVNIFSGLWNLLGLGPLTRWGLVPQYGQVILASQVALVVKNPPANAGDISDVGLIPGSGRFPGEGPGNPLQYSCLENPMDKGAWRATTHGVTKSWTQLKQFACVAPQCSRCCCCCFC